jgi:hypothetical protein
MKKAPKDSSMFWQETTYKRKQEKYALELGDRPALAYIIHKNNDWLKLLYMHLNL